MVTPDVFAEFPGRNARRGVDPERVEELIRSTGFFRSKTRSLIGMARALVERFDGQVPVAMEELVTLPGVGRKTANVLRSVAFGVPGLPVDTHVARCSRRLGLTESRDPEVIERDLDALIPPDERGTFSLRLILHGRAVCVARTPALCRLHARWTSVPAAAGAEPGGPRPCGFPAGWPRSRGAARTGCRKRGRRRSPKWRRRLRVGCRHFIWPACATARSSLKSSCEQLRSAPGVVRWLLEPVPANLVPPSDVPGSAAWPARTTAPSGAPSSRVCPVFPMTRR